GDRRAHAGAAHRAGAGESAAGLLLVACGDPEELFAGKPWVCCLAPFVPAKAGTQGQTHGFSKVWVPACAGTNGERTLLRPVHLALMLSKERIANAMLVPDLGRARESPSLFPSPMRGWPRPFPLPKGGGGRAEQAGKKKRTPPSRRPRGFSRFRVPRCPDPGRPVVAGGASRGSARGCSCEPHPQVPHPAPPSRRLMKAPLSGRDACNLR